MKKLDLEFIRKRRKQLGLTLQDMATATDLKDPANYYRYERGAHRFRANHLPVLAEMLSCEIEHLFRGPSFFDRQFEETAK